jgi:hypothetical protein
VTLIRPFDQVKKLSSLPAGICVIFATSPDAWFDRFIEAFARNRGDETALGPKYMPRAMAGLPCRAGPTENREWRRALQAQPTQTDAYHPDT